MSKQHRGAPTRRTRIAACVAASALAVSLVVATPAGAATPPPATDALPDTVPIEGVLLVLPDEPVPTVHGQEPAPVPTTDTVLLLTPDGTKVELTGDALVGAVSGDSFSGTVAVDGAVADAVEDAVADAVGTGGDADSPEALGDLVVEAGAELDAPLEVVTGDVIPVVQAAAAAKAHTVDVLYARPSGGALPTSADIDKAVARLSEFWSSQSNGQITKITRPNAVKFVTVSASRLCSQDWMWNYASGPSGFNRKAIYNGDPSSYYWASGSGRHLAVIVPGSACGAGNGLGSIGSIHAGGVTWSSIDPDPVNWDGVLFHEIGHNLGLGHSNVRTCAYPKVDGSSCADAEYYDFYDVMGGGHSYNEYSNESHVAALNVTHKAHLDALPRTGTTPSLRKVAYSTAASATQTFTLAPASATSGLRGLEIVDPLNTASRFYIEYRSGTGRDAESFYTRLSADPDLDVHTFAPGVRVLKVACTLPGTCPGAASAVLVNWASPTDDRLSFAAGDDFVSSTSSGGAAGVRVSVVSTSASSAVVEVSFDSKLKQFTKPTIAVAGTPSYYKVLTAKVGAWTQTPDSLTYQWLRGDAPIAGATTSSYRVQAADLGTKVSVRATAKKAGYAKATITSAAVSVATDWQPLRVSGTIGLPAGVPTSAREGMMVRAFAVGDQPPYSSSTAFATVDATTGAYQLTGLAPGRWVLHVEPGARGADVAAQWSGGVATKSAATPFVLDANRTGVSVTLSPSRRISGTVTLPPGSPSSWLQYLYVTAEPRNEHTDEYGSARLGEVAVNPVTGAYTLVGLDPTDAYRIRFEVRREWDDPVVALVSEWYRGSFTREGATGVSTADGNRTGIDATLTKQRTITGTIVASGMSGAWASGVSITGWGPGGESAWGEVDPDGRFSLAGLTPGDWRLCADPNSLEDFVTTCTGGAFTIRRATPVATAVGDASGITITLQRATRIDGTITGATAPQLASTVVTAFPLSVTGDIDDGLPMLRAWVPESGQFSLPGALPVSYAVQFDVPESLWTTGAETPTGLADVWLGGTPTRAGSTLLDLRANRRADITLPKATARISGTISVANLTALEVAGSNLVLMDAAGLQEVATAYPDGGLFRFDHLVPGSYRIALQATGLRSGEWSGAAQYLRAPGGSKLFTVTTGQVLSGQALSATAATSLVAGSLTIAGFAREYGTLAKAYLYERDGSAWIRFPQPLASLGTNTTQRFTSDLLTPGSYTIGYLAGDVAYIEATAPIVQEWWQHRATLATADAVTLAAGTIVSGLHGAVHPVGVTPPVVTDPPLPSAKPGISGTPKVGAKLTATTAGWPSGSTFAYQWAVGGTAVSGATASTFTPTAAHYGKTVTVTVTGSKPGYTASTSTSAASATIAAGSLTAPTPTISGTAKVGLTLTAKPGAWTTGTAFAYQWYVAGKAVSGATKSTFVPRSADAGKTVTVKVTGRLTAYTTTSKTSKATGKVAKASTLKTATPKISGTAKVGLTLKASPGTWTTGTTFTYQWYVKGKAVSGATKTTFVLRTADAGKTVTVKVTGKKAGYVTASKTSKATGKVAKASALKTATPTISGTARVGVTLTAKPGTWTSGTTRTYQWYVAGKAVAGATKTTFVPRAADAGKTVTVKVTGKKAGYVMASKTSKATGKVALGILTAGTPVISGTPVVGATLTAGPGTWSTGVSLAYQWSVGGVAVAGATASTFVPRPEDVGLTVTVTVTGTKAGYTTVVKTAAAVGPVTA